MKKSDQDRLISIAGAVADGAGVDWDDAEASAASPEARELIGLLRVIADLAQVHQNVARESSPTPLEETVPRRHWGPLEIREEIGGGSFGTVYRAWDSRLDREVALKLLRTTEPAELDVATTVIDEGRLLARIRHTNVVTVFGADCFDSKVGLWMEFVNGRTLKAIQQEQGAFSAQEAALIGLDLCGALAAVHRSGILHRDVKAQNVMREAGGRIVLMDFGAGDVVGGVANSRSTLRGTPLYLAPEVLQGARPTVHSDLYSLGVLLYHLVTNEFPVWGDSVVELLKAHERPKRRLLRDIRPDLPAAFVRVIDVATAILPDDRPESAGAMAGLLEAAVTAPFSIPMPRFAHSSTKPAASEVERTSEPPKDRGVDPAAEEAIRGHDESRQVTVLSCELADFGALGEHLDPERLRELLNSYHTACELEAQPFDGQVTFCLDAELRIYFGLPQAHEDDAVRAVNAGLAIAARIKTLSFEMSHTFAALADTPLAVRVGIHTGQVIAGDCGTGLKQTIVGMVGTLAATAQEAAAPGQVLITEDSYRLVRDFFEVKAFGEGRLSGASRPIRLHRVVKRTGVVSRIEAAATVGLTELVGRSRELELLSDKWNEVKDGAGQVVLLSADAGIGKSRLVEALKTKLSTESYVKLECRCSPYQRNSPLSPIVELLTRAFRLDRLNSAGEKIDRLREILAKYGMSIPEDLALFARLLLVPISDDPPELGPTPQRQRERTLSALLQLLLALSAEHSALLVVEDLHWVDPTTLELIGLVVDQGTTAPILTILTFRPEFTPPWGQRPDLTLINLSRLPRRDAQRMVERLVGSKPLPREVLSKVVSNSDGVPLFIEELTKAVLESSELRETTDAYELATPSATLTIPATLKDSLMARLDRLGAAKTVAQIASVIGRTFSYEWLEAIWPPGGHLLRHNLSRLVDVGLLFQQGMTPHAKYTFKHILIKDAAYLSLLPGVRQQYHARIAMMLEARFPEIADSEPELIAHHYTDAAVTERAIIYWQRAGQQAIVRSAHVEAAAHFSKALELLRSLPDTVARKQQQLELVIAIGNARVATMGYAAKQVGEAFAEARELSEKVGESPQLFDALQGLYSFHLVRAELKPALELSTRLTDLAARLDDRARGLDAQLRRGISLYTLGKLKAARHHLEAVLTRSDPKEGRDTVLLFGQDRLVATLSHLSLVLWLLGYPDRAVALNQQALDRARKLSHPFSLAFALLYAAIVHTLRREASAVRDDSLALGTLCQEQGFAYRHSQSQILQGWAGASTEFDTKAIEQIQFGIEKTRATGAEVLRPYYLTLCADASLQAKCVSVGLASVEEALQVVERSSERFFEAELYRLRGELLVAGESHSHDATASYLRALGSAHSQAARSLELRAAVAYARLEPHDREVRRRVAKVMESFTEGFETPDLRAAAQLLSQAI
jgi:TOMM system kinase/cyclase fusion protein